MVGLVVQTADLDRNYFGALLTDHRQGALALNFLLNHDPHPDRRSADLAGGPS